MVYQGRRRKNNKTYPRPTNSSGTNYRSGSEVQKMMGCGYSQGNDGTGFFIFLILVIIGIIVALVVSASNK